MLINDHGNCIMMAMQDPAVFREKINQMQRALDKITGVKKVTQQEKQQ